MRYVQYFICRQLGKVLEALRNQLETKGRELQEYREKHNIQIRGENDTKTAAAADASSTSKSSGVLVASSSS
jgi:prefoldin subunit 2